LIAIGTRLEPSPDIAFSQSVGICLGRHGIHLGRVDEVHTRVERSIKLSMGLGLGVLLSPGHRAQTDDAHI